MILLQSFSPCVTSVVTWHNQLIQQIAHDLRSPADCVGIALYGVCSAAFATFKVVEGTCGRENTSRMFRDRTQCADPVPHYAAITLGIFLSMEAFAIVCKYYKKAHGVGYAPFGGLNGGRVITSITNMHVTQKPMWHRKIN